jgi:hypothetical protein
VLPPGNSSDSIIAIATTIDERLFETVLGPIENAQGRGLVLMVYKTQVLNCSVLIQSIGVVLVCGFLVRIVGCCGLVHTSLALPSFLYDSENIVVDAGVEEVSGIPRALASHPSLPTQSLSLNVPCVHLP